MPEQPAQHPEQSIHQRIREVQARLKRLERREWWLWSVAMVVMLLLTAGVALLSFPSLLAGDDFFLFERDQAIRGLVGLVLLFNTYTIYQQIMAKRLRRELGNQLETMVRLDTQAQEFQKLAMNDGLTGLYNRRYIEQRLRAEAARSRRHGSPLSVVVFDLNLFKQTNDTYGHAAGDLVLKTFAERLTNSVRISDLPARLGGDEFMALLPECRPEQVQHLLDRIGSPVADFNGTPIPVLYSAGWAGYQPGEPVEEMLARADQHLYENKRQSRQPREAVPTAT